MNPKRMDMLPKTLHLVGRILMGLPYFAFGMAHLLFPDDFIDKQPAFMGGHLAWVYAFGVVMIALAVSFVTGKLGLYSAFGLAGLLFVLMLGIQVPLALSSDPVVRKEGIDQVFKGLGLVGGYLGFAAYFASQRKLAAIPYSAS
ncbi:MAG: hypothetical protein U0176_15550 [Bacteroidia bacterium]